VYRDTCGWFAAEIVAWMLLEERAFATLSLLPFHNKAPNNQPEDNIFARPPVLQGNILASPGCYSGAAWNAHERVILFLITVIVPQTNALSSLFGQFAWSG
jgi:hypothetical protein